MQNSHVLLLGLPFSSKGESQALAQFNAFKRELGALGDFAQSFLVPTTLKVGTLDSLMEASDDLAKVDPQLEGTVMKLVALMEEVSQKPRSAVTTLRTSHAQEFTALGYLGAFNWNAAQFDTKEPIRVLVERLTSVGTGAEERVRQLLTEYTETRGKLQAASRRSQGNLAQRPIGDAVKKWVQWMRQPVVDTELLATLFVAVPVAAQKDWAESYWTFNKFVCPRSSTVVAEDKEVVLNSVVIFKKAVDDFKLECRKRKFTVRDSSEAAADGTAASASDELQQLTVKAEQERQALMSLLAQQYALCYVAWIHSKALRIFVESLLRYGLPPRFFGALLVVPDERKEAEVRKRIATVYPDLAQPFGGQDVGGAAAHHEAGALQHDVGYVLLKVTNVTKGI